MCCEELIIFGCRLLNYVLGDFLLSDINESNIKYVLGELKIVFVDDFFVVIGLGELMSIVIVCRLLGDVDELIEV